ncbi:MAG: GMC family oxidoreductase N-terminal domain-containing protein [Pseudomonadota bacterium]
MTQTFDFIVVGAGSAGAALAARLSQDPSVTVALIEAGRKPPEREAMPAACATLQLDPETDWMFTGATGKAGRGLKGRRMPVPRGKMLGGSSAINYMVWVRGHPGDFDNWATKGGDGWAFEDVLPCFKRMEEVRPSNEIVLDQDQRGDAGPVGVGVRSPVIPASRQFVQAANAAGIPEGDYNGRDRFNPDGVSSLVQTNTRSGKRASTYHSYLEGKAESRPNLTIITDALVTRVLLEDGPDGLTSRGIEYRDRDGALHQIEARRETILSSGAIGSPHVLMLSGIGGRRELESVGVTCRLDLPGVGKHLKDHLYVPLAFPAENIGLPASEIATSMGSDSLRGPDGPLPEDPADDVNLSDELKALKTEADQRLKEWEETGSGLAASSFYDGIAFFSTGLGDDHTHDAQIGFNATGNVASLFREQLNIDTDFFSDDIESDFSAESENVSLIASNCVPRSEGEITLVSADPSVPPEIDFNYYSDPYDLKVMVAIVRRTLEVAANWPGPHKLGPLRIPPKLRELHGYKDGERPSDALLENLALHVSMTIYHLCCTCRMGDVVDSRLNVFGVSNLRVADASVMPEIVSGNTNAASIMIGERAADILADDHGLNLATDEAAKEVA